MIVASRTQTEVSSLFFGRFRKPVIAIAPFPSIVALMIRFYPLQHAPEAATFKA